MKNIEVLLSEYFLDLFKRLQYLEKRVTELGVACKTAFDQNKIVIQHLAETQQILNEDLSEYGGVIQSSTFYTGINNQ